MRLMSDDIWTDILDSHNLQTVRLGAYLNTTTKLYASNTRKTKNSL